MSPLNYGRPAPGYFAQEGRQVLAGTSGVMTAEARRYFRRAYHVASVSVDPSTQNGAVMVSRSGDVIAECNQPSLGITVHHEDFDRDKPFWMEHAERAVILRAARAGISTEGAVLFAPWAACADCARAIVMAGITKVHRHVEALELTPLRWAPSTNAGEQILKASGIQVLNHRGQVGESIVRFDGSLWRP
jgi:deoxycytidylate deaminase